jgi:hypothetical protein
MHLLLALTLAFDLAAVRQEPKLDKRSDLALEHADKSISAARKAYEEGRWEQSQTALKEVQEAVDLSYDSLMATGKDPRKNSGPFKRAEKATREILRRLSGLRDLMSSVDHSAVDPVVASVTETHNSLLQGIMSGK